VPGLPHGPDADALTRGAELPGSQRFLPGFGYGHETFSQLEG